MRYNVTFSDTALENLNFLSKHEPASYKKALILIDELYEHPRTGRGKPKMLTGDRSGQWSRRITDRHRLVYTIEDDILKVLVLTSSGHYNDK